MDKKYTMLLYQTPDTVRSVAQGAFVVAYSPMTNQLEEYRFPSAVPELSPAYTLFTVPAATVEPAYAIHGAITCTKPDPRSQPFMPSFCFSFKMRYISPIGLKRLMLEFSQKEQSMPECIDLEKFYLFMLPQMQNAAQKAAAQFSGGRLLPYAYW